jgi:hypothetical protein
MLKELAIELNRAREKNSLGDLVALLPRLEYYSDRLAWGLDLSIQRKDFKGFSSIMKLVHDAEQLNVEYLLRGGKSLLMLACEKGSLQFLECLVSRGCNFRLTDRDEANCCFYAARNKDHGCQLLAALSDLDPSLLSSKKKNNASLLLAAVESRNYKACLWMLKVTDFDVN